MVESINLHPSWHSPRIVDRQEEPRTGDWMQTFSGNCFYPLDPRPEEIDIEDLANHLSQIGRYNGACKRFYSVAEHCFHVSYHVPAGMELDGLLHDAPEGLGLGDIIAPVKRDPRIKPIIKPIEDRLHRAIAIRFGIQHPIPAEVEKVDFDITADEKEQAMRPCVRPWWRVSDTPLGIRVQFWDSDRAKFMFMARFKEITTGDPWR